MITIDDAFKDWLIEVRQDLHRHPELSLHEERTTQVIESHLRDNGIIVQPFQDMTGTVGLITGSEPGPTLALRADIDALPITERNNVPYKSVNEGVMHACGHDAHTTILLGVGKLIMNLGLQKHFKGNVKLLFQPAEEVGRGARMMIDRGVLESPRVDRVLAAHVTGDLIEGQVGISRGTSHSSCDVFHIIITGRGAHGGRPHQSNDPIVAGAHLVTTIQSIISRNINPLEPAVITVGEFLAGSANNIIPETARLSGSIRAFNPNVQQILQRRLREVVSGTTETFGVACDLRIERTFPPCPNEDEVVNFIEAIAIKTVGAENVVYPEPVTAAEDYALFLQERPGAIIRLGCGHPDRKPLLHSPQFDFGPEVLFTGVRVFTEALIHYLASEERQRPNEYQHITQRKRRESHV